MKKSVPKRVQRFLVVSTTAIGDTLMGTPALRALRESFPQSEIHVLVHSKRKGLLFGNPHINRIFGYRNNFFHRGLLFLKAWPFYYDHVLVFHANEDVWKILKMIRYGDCYNRQNYKDLPRRILPVDHLPPHSIQRRLALVEKVGGKKSDDYRYEYFLPSEYVQWAGEQLGRWGISPKDRVVGMQLGAADSFKRWPLESFVEVARRLHATHGVKIYVNASPEEKDLVHRFRAALGGDYVFSVTGVSLFQSAALLRACALFLSIDTGPMHMAIGLGIPLIGLFCPTLVQESGPLGYSQAIVIQKPQPCEPCLSRKCKDNFCMRQISVEEVCLAAAHFLKGSQAGVERGRG